MADPKKQEVQKPQGQGSPIPPKPEPVALTAQQELDRKALIQKTTEEHAAKAAQVPVGPDPKEIAAKALEKVQADRAAQPAPVAGQPGKPDRWPDRKKKSTLSSPVKFVWELAEAMTAADPTIRRKDVVDAAINAGVAGYTARTQYQQWYTFRRESQRNAAQVQAAQRASGGAK